MNDIQKAAIHELLEIALTTPKETADVSVEISTASFGVYVRIWFGGQKGRTIVDFSEHAYFEDSPANGVTPAMLLERVKKALHSKPYEPHNRNHY